MTKLHRFNAKMESQWNNDALVYEQYQLWTISTY